MTRRGLLLLCAGSLGGSQVIAVEVDVALSGRICPDCNRRVRRPFQDTISGRQVCPDCATALALGSSVGAVSGAAAGGGVWAMLMRKLRRSG